jgi:hypothetical protein
MKRKQSRDQCPMCAASDDSVEAVLGYLAYVMRIVHERGWAVQGVFPTDDCPGDEFAYSVGFTKMGHPEVVVVGLGSDAGGVLINAVGRRIANGERFEDGDVLAASEGLGRFGFVECDNDELGVARQLYGDDVRALQLLWPDSAGHLPWDADYDRSFHQPIWA